jgi:hypothetical protein
MANKPSVVGTRQLSENLWSAKLPDGSQRLGRTAEEAVQAALNLHTVRTTNAPYNA